MPLDELDGLIRRAVAREVDEGVATLEGLEARVTRRLAHPPVRRPVWERIVPSLPTVRLQLRWATAGGLALLAVGFIVGRISFPPASGGISPAGANTFSVAAPAARSVTVVGDFSAWQPISLFDHNGDGVWSVTVALPPGRYEYAFVVDGRWVGQDPRAEEFVRTFGEFVSVRYIREEEL